MSFINEFKRNITQELPPDEKKRRENIKKGKESFRSYCNLINSNFYRVQRSYQDKVCNTMQAVYRKELINPVTKKPYDILLLNLPPGFGKSYTASLFATWVFGDNIKNQIITVSYGQDLAIDFAKTVRDTISEEEDFNDINSYVPTTFFPNLQIKRGDGAMDKWALVGNYMSYLGTSFGGKLTGMRGNIIIVDDPIKNAEEAVNENIKEKHWNFYKNTLTSRMLPGAVQFIIQTRWASNDLAGKIKDEFPDRCIELRMPALDENDKSICEDLYPTEDLIQKRETADEHIWSANFMQLPIDLKGALYGDFKTYDVVDYTSFERSIAYIDTADEGSDSLCAIMGGVIGRYGYVTDIYFTEESMETTEPETARRLNQADTREALIESNNGGRGFARNVISNLQRLKNRKCNITWFHQSKNKRTRIIVNSANVMEQIIMPEDWKKRWPSFYKAISTYQRKGKNAHDDAPDGITGFVEMINGDVKGKKKVKVLKRSWFGI